MSEKKSTTTEAEPLDIDAWIDGAELPEAEVTLAGKGKTLAVLTDLRERRAKDLRNRRRGVAPGRMAPMDETHELDEEIAELAAEVRASERTFRVRAVDGDTHQAIITQHRDAGDQAVGEAVVAAAMVPPMTVEQVHRLRLAVGEGQFSLLARTVNRVSFDAPSLDF